MFDELYEIYSYRMLLLFKILCVRNVSIEFTKWRAVQVHKLGVEHYLI
jgi:hypothetical protein